MSGTGIVPMKPYCRHCGAQVQKLRRCPRCGKRNWQILGPRPWTH